MVSTAWVIGRHAALAALLAATPSARGDFFVDVAAGVDAPSGGTAASPWKTISYALEQVSGTGHVIHVAPGSYTAAAGESFPLPMEPGVSVRASVPGTAELVAGPQATLVHFRSHDGAFSPSVEFGPDTRLEGLVLRGAGVGVRVENDGQSFTLDCGPTLQRLSFRQCEEGLVLDGHGDALVDPEVLGCAFESCTWGIRVDCTAVLKVRPRIEGCRFEGCCVGFQAPCPGDTIEPVLRRSVFQSCGRGVVVGGPVVGVNGTLEIEECAFLDCGFGVAWGGGSYASTAELVLARCELRRSTGSALRVSSNTLGSAQVFLRDTLLADGAQAVDAVGGSGLTPLSVGLSGCTVANNAVGFDGQGFRGYGIVLSNLWGNSPSFADAGDPFPPGIGISCPTPTSWRRSPRPTSPWTRSSPTLPARTTT